MKRKRIVNITTEKFQDWEWLDRWASGNGYRMNREFACAMDPNHEEERIEPAIRWKYEKEKSRQG